LANGRSLTEGEKSTTNCRYLFASREVRSAKMTTCLDLVVDRRQAARFGINVADVQDTVQTPIGGNAVSQVLQSEARYDDVVRYQTPYREEGTPGASATPNTLST
jgi:Cu/Ag efflux pump CusA